MSTPFWKHAIQVMCKKLGKDSSLLEDDEYLLIKEVYTRSEGSWKGLAQGDSDSWVMMRKCCVEFWKRKINEGSKQSDPRT